MKKADLKTATAALSGMALFLGISTVILAIDAVSGIRTSPGARSEPAGSMVPVAGRATLGSAVPALGSVLQPHEIAHMRYMREEEKLAQDVYRLLATRWSVPVFGKIATAEQRHTEAVRTLLVRYGVPDPSQDAPPGQFTDPHLADLYQTLIQKGTVSLTDALLVGGLIEEVDIADLKNATASTNRSDIIRVYENIHRGSRNHLRAFARTLAQNGITYQAQKLKFAEVQAILSTPMENGPPI